MSYMRALWSTTGLNAGGPPRLERARRRSRACARRAAQRNILLRFGAYPSLTYLPESKVAATDGFMKGRNPRADDASIQDECAQG